MEGFFIDQVRLYILQEGDEIVSNQKNLTEYLMTLKS